jgi:hypothetical protein
MSAPTDNETWVIETGDAIIQKKASAGVTALAPKEKLLYCLWVADYFMRNAGDLETARDLYAGFQEEGATLAKSLALDFTSETFALPEEDCGASILSDSTVYAMKSKRATRRQSQRPWLSRLVLRAARAAPAMVVAHLER